MTTTLDRLDASQQKLNKLQAELSSSNRLTLIVGGVMLVVLAGYFAFGYREIKKLVEPETLVPYGAQMLQEQIPEARHAIVQQVSTSAPVWAEQVSVRLRDELPGMRTKIEEYVLHHTDELLQQVSTISEDHIRKALKDNKDILDTHIRELADHEQLSEASAQALVTALEGALQQDLKDQSELVLQTVQGLDTRVRELAKGEGLDEEEAIERRILMLARRIQLSEADPHPIVAPVVAPLVKAEAAPAADAKPVAEAAPAATASTPLAAEAAAPPATPPAP